MGVLLKLFFIGVGLYYLLKFVGRILLGSFFVKMARQQQSQGFRGQQHASHNREGDVNIKFSPKDNSKHVKGGDYIDFEEVN